MYYVKCKALRPLFGDFGSPNEGQIFTTDNETADKLETDGVARRLRDGDSLNVSTLLEKMRAVPENKMMHVAENKAPKVAEPFRDVPVCDEGPSALATVRDSVLQSANVSEPRVVDYRGRQGRAQRHS